MKEKENVKENVVIPDLIGNLKKMKRDPRLREDDRGILIILKKN